MRQTVSILVLTLIMGVCDSHSQNAYTAVFSDTNQYGDTLYYYLGYGGATLCAPNALDSSDWGEWYGGIHYMYRPDSEWWAGYNLPTGDIYVPDSVTYNEQRYPVCGISSSFSGSLLSSISLPGTIYDNQGRWYHDTTVLNLYWRGNIKKFLNAGSIYAFGQYNLYLDDTLVTDLVIPEGVVYFGSYDSPPFAGCQSLRRITLPHSCIDIGMQTFRGCSNLEEFICLSDSMGGSWSMVFENCTSLKYIQLPECKMNQWGYSSYSLGDHCFSGCTSLTTIALPDNIGLNNAWNGIFANCSNLDTIIMGHVPPRMNRYVNDGWQPDEAIFGGRFDSILFLIPCESYETYQHVCKYDNGYSEEDEYYECLEYWYFHNLEEVKSSFSVGIHVSLSDTAHGSVVGTYIDCNSTYTIQASPDYGYHVQWNDGDTSNPRIIKLTRDTIFTASFVKNVYDIAVFSDNIIMGEVDKDTIVQYLDSITLTATPYCGYHFSMWNDGDTSNPRNIQVTSDSVFTAMFNYNQYNIVLSTDTNYHGMVSGDGIFNYLNEQTITATPNYGYHFMQWNDGDTTNPRIIMLTQDTAFTAIFDKNNYHLLVFSADSVMGTATTIDTTLLYLDTITITATPNYGYHFTQWSDGNIENPRIMLVNCDSVITATFEKNQYLISLYVDSNTKGAALMNAMEYTDLAFTLVYFSHSHDTMQWILYWTDSTLIAETDESWWWFSDFENGTRRNQILIDYITSNWIRMDTLRTVINHSDYGTKTYQQLLNEAFDGLYRFMDWPDAPDYACLGRWYLNELDNSTHRDFVLYRTMQQVEASENSVSYLDSISIYAIPNYGYHFNQWSDGDTNNPRMVAMTQDTSFTAMFVLNQYMVSVHSNDTTIGMVTGDGSIVYYDDSIAISAICTALHHHFVQWSDGDTNAIRMVSVTCDTLFTAIFAIDTHTVNYVADSSMGNVDGPYMAPYGSTVTLTAIAKDGYHFGAWSNGVIDNPYTFTVEGDTAVYAIFTDDLFPELCMVGVSDWKNQLIWEPLEEPCAAYRLYREGEVAGIYELLAEVPYDSATTFIDSTSRPMTRSYRYRISGVDPYGHEGEQSQEHKTMHLTISQGVGNRWNLVWTEYEGAEYTTYIIYRGTNQDDLQQIDILSSGGNTTYTDEEAPAGDVYYQVGVVMTNPCSPTKASNISLSNIATNGEIGIYTLTDDGVLVHVTHGRIKAAGGADMPSWAVYDVMGRMVASLPCAGETQELPAGVYMVKIGTYPVRRVVVVK